MTNKQGAISVGVKGVNSLGGMVAFRIALGIVEAGYFPGVMLLLSCWYKVSRAVLAIGQYVDKPLTPSRPSCRNELPSSTPLPSSLALSVVSSLEVSSKAWRDSPTREAGNGSS